MARTGAAPRYDPTVTARAPDRLIAPAALLLLAAGCLLVLWPFLTPLAWAAILVTTSWSPFLRLERALGHRRTLAASLMTLAVTLALLVPVTVAAIGLSANVSDLVRGTRELIAQGLPSPPAWLADVPVVGPWLQRYWAAFDHDGARLAAELKRLLPQAQALALRTGSIVTRGVFDVAVSIFLGFFLFLHGEAIAARVATALERLGGRLGGHLLELTRSTVAGVVYGVLGTALAQSVLATIGLMIAGVPGAVLLGVATFFLSVVPIGPPLVWGGAAIWLLRNDMAGWALFVAVWGFLVVSTVDNLIKPLIISRGARLPFAVTFVGVLGGVFAFGVIGAFLGPALLAVGWRLVIAWTGSPEHRDAKRAPAERRGRDTPT